MILSRISETIRRIPNVFQEPFRRENPPVRRPFFAELLRRFAVPVIAGWTLLALVLNLVIPQLESVVADHTGPFVPTNFQSAEALRDMGKDFHESSTDNTAFILLESDDPLDDHARNLYKKLVTELRADSTHVHYVLDLWGDPTMAVANESADGKAAYVLIFLAGDMGTTQGKEAIDSVREIVEQQSSPSGLHIYVTGPGPVTNDLLASIDHDMLILSAITGLLIYLLLLIVYRSPITALVPLISVGLSLAVARAIVGLFGMYEAIPVSMMASTLLSGMILGAGTDYSIFLLGRYHESRRQGRDFVDAFHDSYRSIAHVVLASGTTVAGACACMGMTQLSPLQTAGIPCAIGILVAVAVSLTATPALIEITRLLGFLEPRKTAKTRLWRAMGTVVTRWPGPVFTASVAIIALFFLVLPGARVSFNEKEGQPSTNPGLLGYSAADRHFPANRLSPEFALIRSDHDLRNPADLVTLDSVAAKLASQPSISLVQSVTRPLGKKLEQGALTYQAGYIGDRVSVSSSLAETNFEAFDTLLSVLDQISAATLSLTTAMDNMAGNLGHVQQGAHHVQSATGTIQQGSKHVQESVKALQGAAGLVDEKVAPIRDLVEANPRCDEEELCHLTQSLLAGLDGVEGLSPGITNLTQGLDQMLAGLTPMITGTGALSQNLDAATSAFPILRATISQVHTLTNTLASLVRVTLPQIKDIVTYLHELRVNVGNGESGGFYLPQEAFSDERFQSALHVLASPDGKSVRIMVYGPDESFSTAGTQRANLVRHVVHDALHGTPLENATVQIGGVSATMADIQQVLRRDFTLLIVTTLTFVFVIILLVLRSIVAAVCIIGTVILSYGAALGISVIVWQYFLHIDLQWGVREIAFVALVAVGSDYNLLLCSRIKEDMHAGLRTGMIRAFDGTGSVVTTAGIVFGITMFALITSEITRVQQLGSVVGLGLILDTLIVRSFLLPSIASLLGRWFWWPLRVPLKKSLVKSSAAL